MEWHEYIQDHIEGELFHDEPPVETIAGIADDVKTLMLESDGISHIIYRTIYNADLNDIGYSMGVLFEEQLANYCEQNADELKDKFPDQWEEFKNDGIDDGDEVDT